MKEIAPDGVRSTPGATYNLPSKEGFVVQMHSSSKAEAKPYLTTESSTYRVRFSYRLAVGVDSWTPYECYRQWRRRPTKAQAAHQVRRLVSRWTRYPEHILKVRVDLVEPVK